MNGVASPTPDSAFRQPVHPRVAFTGISFLMRRTVLALLAVLMAASACTNDASDIDVGTPVDEPTVTETPDTGPAAPRDGLPAVLPAVGRPAYDPAGAAAVYLHGLAVWVLETDDGVAPSDPDDLTVAARQPSECYASTFVSVLGPGTCP